MAERLALGIANSFPPIGDAPKRTSNEKGAIYSGRDHWECAGRRSYRVLRNPGQLSAVVLAGTRSGSYKNSPQARNRIVCSWRLSVDLRLALEPQEVAGTNRVSGPGVL